MLLLAAPAPFATLSGNVYHDANNNGVFDTGESGIGGVAVTLSGTTGEGSATTPITPITIQTAADGSYSFPDLLAGAYTVTEGTVPSPYLDGIDTAGSKGGDATATNDVISAINLNVGENSTGNNFGEVLAGIHIVKDGPATAPDGSQATFTYTVTNTGDVPLSNVGVIDDNGTPGLTTDDLTAVYVTGDANSNNLLETDETWTFHATTTLSALSTLIGNLPSQANMTVSYPGANSYLVATITNGGILNGTYEDWCIDTSHGISPGHTYTVNVVAPTNLNQVNWVLNQGYTGKDAGGGLGAYTPSDVQSAIWTLTGNNPNGAGLGVHDPRRVAQIVAQAQAFGQSFVPGPGQIFAVELIPIDGSQVHIAQITVSAAGVPGNYHNTAVTNGTYKQTPVTDTDDHTTTITPATASLGNYVWIDANDDGIQQSSEAGIAGITVNLLDSTGTTVLGTTTTVLGGFYQFLNLTPGVGYKVAFGTTGGYASTLRHVGGNTANDSDGPTSDTVVLAAGQYNDTIDAGFVKLSSLAGYVYVDANDDGTFQGTESPISGTTVTLTGTDDLGNPVSVVATTDSTGAYSFTGLRPGTYVLTETQPAGYLDGKDTVGTPGGVAGNDVFSAINLGAGVNGVDNNFGELLASSIAGFVYVDANNNGVKETSEAAIAGTTVTLTGTDDLGNPVSVVATTDSTGAYSFTGLRPGTYVLTETQPAGYLDGKDTVGTPGGVAGNDVFSAINLGAGVNGVENNFGELLASSIAGFVYVDANNNGVKETSEAAIPGATVTLTGTDDLGQSVSVVATTDSTGAYSFTGLRPGTYVLTETQPGGYLDGKDTIGTPGGTAGNDVFSNIVLGAGVNGVDNNFGELKPASIAGYVYLDSNNDGSRTGDTGISGVTVTLTGTNDLGQSVSLTKTTAADGSYKFDGLRPGTYVLTETQPAAYLDGKDTIGTPGGTTTNDKFSSIVLVAGVNGTENNFGELTPATASICGTVWYDCNANATIDSSEMGRSGVTVYLDANSNGQFDSGEVSTTTDANGDYTFSNLAAGTYKVREVIPLSFRQSTANPSTITLASNDKASNVNFGLTATTDGISNFTVLVNGTTTYGDLRGNTSAGDLVQITFTVAPGVVNLPVNLVSYTAPDATFVASRAYQQKVYDVDGGLFSTGTYTLTVVNPNSYFQVDFIVGCVIETLGGSACNYDANDFYTPQGRLISADNGDSCSTAPLSSPGVITGTVFSDADCDGKLDSSEKGVGPVKVYLDANNNGKLDSGEYATYSHPDGSYQFGNLAPGTYRVRMVTPAGQTKTSTDLASVKVTAGRTVAGGDFGLKLVSGNTVGLRTTESLDWWNGATGQALIKSFGGSSSSTGLGNWLATTFPRLYGKDSSCNLSGKSNSYVASRFQSLYSASGDKLEAKAMSLALSVYATTSSLGGVTGMFYGFAVTSQGLGASTYSGSTVLSILTDLNSRVTSGKICGSSSSQRTSAGSLLDQVLLAGDSDRA